MVNIANQWKVLVSQPHDAAYKMPCLLTVKVEGTAASIFLEVCLSDERAFVFFYEPLDLVPDSIKSVDTMTNILSSEEISRIAKRQEVVQRPMTTLDLKPRTRCRVYRNPKPVKKLRSDPSTWEDDQQLQWLANAKEIRVWFDIVLINKDNLAALQNLVERPENFDQLELKKEQLNWVLDNDLFKTESHSYMDLPPPYDMGSVSPLLSTVPNTPERPKSSTANAQETTTTSSQYQDDTQSEPKSPCQKDIPACPSPKHPQSPANTPDLRQLVKEEVNYQLKKFLDSQSAALSKLPQEANPNDDLKSILGVFVPGSVAAMLEKSIAAHASRLVDDAIYDARMQTIGHFETFVEEQMTVINSFVEEVRTDMDLTADDKTTALLERLEQTFESWQSDPLELFRLTEDEDVKKRRRKSKHLQQWEKGLQRREEELQRREEEFQQREKEFQRREKKRRRIEQKEEKRRRIEQKEEERRRREQRE